MKNNHRLGFLFASSALVLLFLLASASAQPYLVMENTRNMPTVTSSRDVGAFANGAAVQVYATRPNSHTTQLSVQKVDSAGVLLWDKFLDQGDREGLHHGKVVALEDGGVVVAWSVERESNEAIENYLYVMRLNTAGDTVWTWDTGTAWPPQDRWVRDLTILDENVVAIGGFCQRPVQPDTGYLLKLDLETGDYISTVFMDTEYGTRRKYATMITPTRIVFSAYCYDVHDYVLDVFDHQGNLVWRYEVDDSFYICSMCTGLNGRIYATGETSRGFYTVYAFDPGGELHWFRTYPTVWNTHDTPLGVISRWRDQSTLIRFERGYLVLLNGQGVRVWEGRLFDDAYSRLHPVEYFPNGDALMGSADSDYPNHTLTIARYHPPDSWYTEVEEAISVETITTFEILPAYPNPFNASTTVQVQIPYAGQVNLSITDILGRVVEQWTIVSPNAGVFPVTWSPNGISSGVYFLRATAPNTAPVVQKLVLTQ